MPKFKAGDSIVHANGHASEYLRIVIGYSTDGHLVYEYKSPINGWSITSGNEDAYKLAPVKKEGWINIWRQSDHHRAGRVHASKEEARAGVERDARLMDTIKIEWEE